MGRAGPRHAAGRRHLPRSAARRSDRGRGHRADPPSTAATIDGFIATSGYYADFMAGYLGLPRDQIHVVYPGLNLTGHGGRASRATGRPVHDRLLRPHLPGEGLPQPRRGVHLALRQTARRAACRLRVVRLARREQPRRTSTRRCAKLRERRAGGRLRARRSPDHADKVRFLQSLDVLSVPTTYREPKGLYVLEALANGVPVVQPRHGSFPELIEATGGGLLVEPERPGRPGAAGWRHAGRRSARAGADWARRAGTQSGHGSRPRRWPGRRWTCWRPYHVTKAADPGVRRAVSQPFAPAGASSSATPTWPASSTSPTSSATWRRPRPTSCTPSACPSPGATATAGTGSPACPSACDFKRPVRFEDVLEIAVTVEEVGRKSVTYRFDFRKDGADVAVGRITAVYCRTTPDHGIESLEIPDAVRAKLTRGTQVAGMNGAANRPPPPPVGRPGRPRFEDPAGDRVHDDLVAPGHDLDLDHLGAVLVGQGDRMDARAGGSAIPSGPWMSGGEGRCLDGGRRGEGHRTAARVGIERTSAGTGPDGTRS